MKYEGKTGVAYGFFNSDVPITKFQEHLEGLCEDVHIPNDLEMTLSDNIETLNPDDKIRNIAQFAREKKDMPYILKASYPNHSNPEASSQLGDLMNEIYNYSDPDAFKTEIVYKEGDKYILRPQGE